ncbi:MAG: hypothetical protein QM765_24910 [Myxococcales bacterium]
MRQRAPSGGQIKEAASGLFQTAVNEQSLLLGLGAILLGLIAGQLIPVSEREQRTMAPLKDKVRDQVSQVQERVEQKMSGAMVPGYPENEPPPLH